MDSLASPPPSFISLRERYDLKSLNKVLTVIFLISAMQFDMAGYFHLIYNFFPVGNKTNLFLRAIFAVGAHKNIAVFIAIGVAGNLSFKMIFHLS
jgi:hypothetical protein